MVDAMISRDRLHDLAALGRSGLTAAGGAGSRKACASPRRLLTDASSIATALRRHRAAAAPEAPSSRPGSYDLTASTI